jgi:hypothetical protein
MYKLGKIMPFYDGKTKGQKFLFTLNIVSTMVDTFSLQLFNVLKSVVNDGTTQNGDFFYPFTINGSEFINLGMSNVGIQTDGSLKFEKVGGTSLIAAAPTDQNLTYGNIYSMMQSGQCLKLTRLSIISDLKEQLTTGTLNVLNISDVGVLTKKSVPLLTFYTPTQTQNNIIDMFINTDLHKNQGLEFTILPLSVATIQFYLEA